MISLFEAAFNHYRLLGQLVSARRVYFVAKRITLYNRIQGSQDLLDIVEELEGLLVDEAPDIVETNLFRYTGRSGPSWLPLPVSWNPFDAVIEAGAETITFSQHPTLIAAHSPPSEGWISGRVERVEDPLDPASYEGVSDKILVIETNHRLAYRLAAEAGAPAVILARKTSGPNSYPYIGLFLTEEEASKYSTPAVTMPLERARALEGKSIRLKIDADIGGPGRLPVLIAWVGDKKGPGPMILGHICHPMPGANDNASGAAASLEAFLAVAQAIEHGTVDPGDSTIRLMLMPEFTGTILGLEGWMSDIGVTAYNLDMVGAGEHAGVEKARAYAPPPAVPLRRAYDYFIVAQRVVEGAARPHYYMFGSDHDAFLSYGKPSLMVNQWPDPNYHSDTDDTNNLDPNRLAATALEAAIAATLESSEINARVYADSTLSSLIQNIMVSHIGRGDMIAARLAGFYLPSRYRIHPLSEPPSEWRPSLSGVLESVYGRVFLGPLQLAPTGLDRAVALERKLENIVERDLVWETYYYALTGSDLRVAESLLSAVYGVETVRNRLPLIVSALEEAGLVRVKS